MTSQVAITGNTYPVKGALKAIGARWNADQKAWMVASDKADAARKIVASGATSTQKAWHPTHCKECHCEASRYNKIYRSGICGNCYRDEREEREMGY